MALALRECHLPQLNRELYVTQTKGQKPLRIARGNGDTIFKDPPTGNVIALDKRRTSVDLSGRTLKELDWLAGGSEKRLRTEALRKSLFLFWMLAGMEVRNIELFIRDDNGRNSLFVTTLNAINGLLRSSGPNDGLRLTLELPARTMKEIDELRKYTGERKIADVIRQAIHLHWILSNEFKKGRRIIAKEENGDTYDLFVPDDEDGDFQILHPANGYG